MGGEKNVGIAVAIEVGHYDGSSAVGQRVKHERSRVELHRPIILLPEDSKVNRRNDSRRIVEAAVLPACRDNMLAAAGIGREIPGERVGEGSVAVLVDVLVVDRLPDAGQREDRCDVGGKSRDAIGARGVGGLERHKPRDGVPSCRTRDSNAGTQPADSHGCSVLDNQHRQGYPSADRLGYATPLLVGAGLQGEALTWRSYRGAPQTHTPLVSNVCSLSHFTQGNPTSKNLKRELISLRNTLLLVQ